MPSSDAVVGAHRCDILAVEQHTAGGRTVCAGDGAEQRRLAGAVGPDQRQDFALVDFKIDVADSLKQAVAHVELLDRQ